MSVDMDRAAFFIMVREAAGLTQTELAKRLRVSRSYVSAVENGTRDPNLDYLAALRRDFGISIDSFLDEFVIF